METGIAIAHKKGHNYDRKQAKKDGINISNVHKKEA